MKVKVIRLFIYEEFHWCVISVDEKKLFEVYNCETEFQARYIAEVQGYVIVD